MKMPSWLRSSGSSSRRFLPLKITSPSVTSYLGLPTRTLERVDLPEPLGPMSTCTSPSRMVRSMPRSISLPSTEAWRLRISNMKTVAVGGEKWDERLASTERRAARTKVPALSSAVCRSELKDCALSGKQRGDAKEMSHALHTSAKILFFFRRANFFHPAFSTLARRDFAPTWKPPPTSPELTRENGGLSAENGEFFAESSQFFERLAGRRKRDKAENESKYKYSLQRSASFSALSDCTRISSG